MFSATLAPGDFVDDIALLFSAFAGSTSALQLRRFDRNLAKL
jgi:hypothetical protein